MALQRSFFDEEIRTRFQSWIEGNPEMVRLCLRFAREAKSAGLTHYSVKAIFERVRWHVEIELKQEGGFRINDHFSSRMARHLIILDPSLDGMFELRELKRA